MQRDVIFIGSRLHDLRKKNSMTIKDLADDLEVSENRIRHYEYGIKQPDMKSFVLLADRFGMPMEYFVEIVERERNGFEIDYVKKQNGIIDPFYVERPEHPLDPAVADLPLEALHLTNRVRNCLARNGCNTIQDVFYSLESGAIIFFRHFGILSLEEIIIKIYRLTGADLRDCYPDLYFSKMEESLQQDN